MRKQRCFCFMYGIFIIGPTPNAVSGHDNVEHIHAVLEEPRSRHQQQSIPTTGPELANMMKIGTRVMRGIDWKWGDQVLKPRLYSVNPDKIR